MMDILHIFGKEISIKKAEFKIRRYIEASDCSFAISATDSSDFLFVYRTDNKGIQPSDLENLFVDWNDISRVVYLYIEGIDDEISPFLPTLGIKFGKWDEKSKMLEVYIKGSVEDEYSFEGIEQFEIYCGCTYIPDN